MCDYQHSMREIALADIPPPGTGKTMVIETNGMADELLGRCAELGWLWADGEKPTPCGKDSSRFPYLYLGHRYIPNRLTFDTTCDIDDVDEGRTLVKSHMDNTHCLICGSPGDMLLFSFCCRNENCRNFRK